MNELKCVKGVLEVAYHAMSSGEEKAPPALVQISIDMLKEWTRRYGETP